MMHIHAVFDLLAAGSAFAMTFLCYRWRLAEAGRRLDTLGLPYAFALIAGALIGGYGFGTLNLWLSGLPGIGRSILGSLFGAITAVELYKAARGLKGSTGLLFVPAFATSAMIGRIGCFLSGLQDQTHGTPTDLPWGHDFGDGILRHPVQLYESLCMAAFLIVALILIGRRNPWFMANGFYALVATYGTQRFLWEFLKPYGTLVGPFNLFHFLCAALVHSALTMMRPQHKAQTT
jgi:phosphatidylglycerol---prolipoprotein diacylglyceryl transferase